MEPVSYPLWKEAVKNFLLLNPQPGHLITHKWLDDQFGLSPGDTITEYEKYQLKKLDHLDKFRKELLEEYQIALKSKSGVGYEVLPPNEQTEFAMKQLSNELHKSFRQAIRLTKHIRFQELTTDEQQTNTDAQMKIAFMMSSVNKAKQLQNLAFNELTEKIA